MAKEYRLSDDQKKKILDYWNDKNNSGSSPSLSELSFHVFGGGVDGRSKEGRAMKGYLASFEIKPRAAQVYVPKERKTLSEEQEAYITNNCKTMTPVELARILFKDNKLNNTSVESRTVNEYIKELNPIETFENPTNSTTNVWKPPCTLIQTINLVNKHFKVSTKIDKDKLNMNQAKEMDSLMKYLNTYRLESQINTYEEVNDRTLFESVFVRYTHDKADLTEEEVDQYIILSNESIMERKIKKRSEHLQKLLDNQTCAGENDSEHARVAMSLVEAIGKATTEFNSCIKRQQDLVNSLKQKRSDRLSKRIQENASILNLIDKWKIEKTRNELIEIAERRKHKVKEEIEKLASMEDVQAKILGISIDEALNG
jgi:hypothetical protein